MTAADFTDFDKVVMVVILLSTLTAWFRGFFREILSIAGWSLSGIVTAQGMPFAQPFFRNMIKSSTVADVVAAASLFVVTMIICAIVSGIITKKIRNSSLSGVDRSLGLVFGALRGGLFIVLIFTFASLVVSPKDMPEAIAEGKTTPFIEQGAAAFSKFIPKDIIKGKSKAEKQEEADKEKSAKDKLGKFDEVYKLMIQPKLKGSEYKGAGYNEEEREELDNLFEENDSYLDSLPPAPKE